MKFIRWFILFLCWILVWWIAIKLNSIDIIQNHTIKNNWLWYYQNKYSRFEIVDALLQEDYYYPENINSWLMIQDAVKAYVDAIDDPYTVYMDAEENSGFMEELESMNQAIGSYNHDWWWICTRYIIRWCS